jgi:hypothetical protein
MGIIIWPGQTPDEDVTPLLPTWVEGEEELERAELKTLIRESLEWKRTHDKPDTIALRLDRLVEYCEAVDQIELCAVLLLIGEIRMSGGASGLLSLYHLVMADLRKDQSCRVCGCTNDHACDGGCHWVAADLCSRCAEAEGIIVQAIRSRHR